MGEQEEKLSQERDLGRLAGALDALANHVSTLSGEMSQIRQATVRNGEHIASLETKCTEISSQVLEIKRTVVLGNGQKSLLSQTTQLKAEHASLKNNVNKVEDDVKKHIDSHDKIAEGRILSKTQLMVGVIALAGTVIVAVGAFAAAMIPLVMQ